MNIKEMRFARYLLAMILIIEGLWFFAVWAVSHKTPYAAAVGTVLLPLAALLCNLIPPEKRMICTGNDLKFLNDLGRGAFFGTASFAVMMLLGLWKYLSPAFVKNALFYVLIGQFALHVFAILILGSLVVLAPKDARKKPLKLAVAIYLISTLMQMVVFPETLKIIG